MNHRMRRIVETLACERRYHIADEKGAEYSGKGSTYKETGADTLHNFKSVAERVGGTPEQALMVYLLKHIDSINTAVREAAEIKPPFVDHGPRAVYAAGEGIVSRLDDARNYLDLLECLLIDNGHIETPVTDAAYDLQRNYDVLGGKEAAQALALGDEEIARQQAEALLDGNLERAGLVECIDGVWRPAATKDASVKNPGEIQTPIYARPAVFEPTKDAERYGETGELT